jgi:antitoxin component YwqK of YwqJK toxin-antitoxin module
VAFNASSQYFSEDGFYQIRKLDTDNFDNFYFNEYEFNPVENAKTLLEIQKIAKDNKIPTVRYTISNESKDVTSVAVFVNNNIFSQAYYKNGLLNGKKTIFHGNGNPFHEIDFVNGKANGVYKMYNERNEFYTSKDAACKALKVRIKTIF